MEELVERLARVYRDVLVYPSSYLLNNFKIASDKLPIGNSFTN